MSLRPIPPSPPEKGADSLGGGSLFIKPIVRMLIVLVTGVEQLSAAEVNRNQCHVSPSIDKELAKLAAPPQADSDENAFLRRRLEAIERTTLKLNIGGASSDLQMLRERLELESTEVVRLREVVAALQKEKLVLSEVGEGNFILSAQEGQGGSM